MVMDFASLVELSTLASHITQFDLVPRMMIGAKELFSKLPQLRTDINLETEKTEASDFMNL